MVRVTVLGSGDAFGSGGRAHSAYLFETPGATFLVDCGPSVLQALKRIGRDPAEIDFVLLSHLHGDHFGGVPFLLMEYKYDAPRTRPLGVYGPPETARRTSELFRALYERSASEALPFALEHRELAADRAAEVAGVRILPFEVPHASELTCFAYRIEAGGRTIVYSGDSAWSDQFVARTRNADLFLCECSTFSTPIPIHISYREIEARAAQLGCRRLVLTHLGREMLAHRGEIALTCAEDGMTIDL